MSDNYHYEDGAKHYDHKKVLHIDKLQGADLQQLMRAFFNDDAEEAEVLEELSELSYSNSEWSADITSRHIVFSTNPLFDCFRNQKSFCLVPTYSQGP